MVDSLTYEPGEGHRGVDLLVRQVQSQDQLEDAECWRLQQVCAASRQRAVSKRWLVETGGLINLRSMHKV